MDDETRRGSDRAGPAHTSDESPGKPLRRPGGQATPRFDGFLERLPLPALMLDGGGIVDANPAALFLLGMEHDRILGRRLVDLASQAEQAADLERQLDEALRGVGESVFSTFLNIENRGPAEVELTVAAREGDGRQGALVLVRDLAERRALEERLRHAQKMELLGQLVGGIAHDFNNLLTAIDGRLELARSAPERSGDELEVVQGCARRAGALARRLLDFSRLRLFNFEVLDVNELLTGVHEFARRLIREDIRLELDLSDELLPVSADRDALEQAILNLIVNAQDAMPDGGRLRLTTTSEVVGVDDLAGLPWLRPGRFVRVEVRDSGIGMDAHMRARIFEPFFSAKSSERGTGLGLSIVYASVKQHRGFIGVESEPGEGSVFWILLPSCSPPVEVEELPASAGAKSAPRKADAPDAAGRVLLVEDEQVVRDLASMALRRSGYQVVDVESAEEAGETFRNASGGFDLLLTDLMLSGNSGQALAAELRSVCPDLRVLFTSGYDIGRFQLAMLDDPGCDFIEKPYTLRELREKVEHLVR